MSQPQPTPMESILILGLKRLLFLAVPWSVINLVFGPGDDPYLYVNVQLVLLQIATFLFVVDMAPFTDEPWFTTRRRSWMASAASLIAAAVGFSALLTISTSAAARYDPSLQFLQLLSSLDIAWVVAALYLGARVLWKNPTAFVLGLLMIGACVASVAIYLDVVGFTAQGGWQVDGEQMMRIILPADMVAAGISVVVFVAGGRRAQATLQARLQS